MVATEKLEERISKREKKIKDLTKKIKSLTQALGKEKSMLKADKETLILQKYSSVLEQLEQKAISPEQALSVLETTRPTHQVHDQQNLNNEEQQKNLEGEK